MGSGVDGTENPTASKARSSKLALKKNGTNNPTPRRMSWRPCLNVQPSRCNRLTVAPDKEENQAHQAKVAENRGHRHEYEPQASLLHGEEGKDHGRNDQEQKDNQLDNLLRPTGLQADRTVSRVAQSSRLP